ncbi:unnamed protein product [Rhodiola kirilowii]
MTYLPSLLACIACLSFFSSALSHSLPPAQSPNHRHHLAPTRPPIHPPAYPPRKPPTHPPVKPPSHPPVKPPTYPPLKPPSHPPVKPPTYPPVNLPTRRFVAVQGVVYCKSCKYVGVPTLQGASPLAGAVVQLVCKSSTKTEVTKGTTNAKGYFFIIPKSTSSYGAHKCKASLVSSPLKKCSKATNLNYGVSGSPLLAPKYQNIGKAPYVVYSVGPFAFEATKKCI